MRNFLLLLCLFGAFGISTMAQRQDVIDDGFTWFESAGTSENTRVNNAPVATGWMLKVWARVMGEFPNRSALKFYGARASCPQRIGSVRN